MVRRLGMVRWRPLRRRLEELVSSVVKRTALQDVLKKRNIEFCALNCSGNPLEIEEVEDVAARTWNYVAVGCGHDLQWWKAFFSVVRMVGYNGPVSLELEDLTMSVEAGIQTSVDALKQTLSQSNKVLRFLAVRPIFL